MKKGVSTYINKWKKKGYSKDIPDEVPNRIDKLNLAPSYKKIALAILKNDVSLKTLGFSQKYSEVYDSIKKEEIKQRNLK